MSENKKHSSAQYHHLLAYRYLLKAARHAQLAKLELSKSTQETPHWIQDFDGILEWMLGKEPELAGSELALEDLLKTLRSK
jgi:hypothetical protein